MSFWWYGAAGVLIGYLCWGLPAQVATAREKRARSNRTEIDRIQGGISRVRYIPNTPPKMFIEERIVHFLRQRWDNLRIFLQLNKEAITEQFRQSWR